MSKKIVAGNWKMNLSRDEAIGLAESLNNMEIPEDVEVCVFPSLPIVDAVSNIISDNIIIGVQNFSSEDKGAFTGESSIAQVRSVGASIGLIGHSERRMLFNESNDFLKKKVNKAIGDEFRFIFCCGEPLEIRKSNTEKAYVKQQLEDSLFHLEKGDIMNRIIAYEPIWAIGTGMTASADQAEEMHGSIRRWLAERYDNEVSESVTILYGGSCNAGNANEIFSQSNVDGGLIGGAALNADTFNAIINAY